MSIINSRGIFNLGTAYLRQVGNDWPTAQVISTSDITEGINLYYNNARVYSNVIALLPTLAGSGIQIQANGQINSNTTLTLDTLSPFLTTSNVAEGSNLYYTNARVLSALTGNVTIGNLITETSVSNSFITSGNVNAGNINVPRIVNNGAYNTQIELGAASGIIAVTTDGNSTQFLPGGSLRLSPAGSKTILSGTFDGSQIVLGTAQTDLVQNRGGAVTVQVGAEGATTNTWTFTNSGNLLAPGAISANNIIADSITSNTWNRLYTANVIESASNLYYTNARVLSALTGNVTIGNLTLTGSGPTLRSYVNSYKGNSESATITLPITPISSNFVTVIINGVAQLSSAYTVSGNVLTFTSYPTTNADIDVRILDVTQPIVGEATAQEQLHPFLLSLL